MKALLAAAATAVMLLTSGCATSVAPAAADTRETAVSQIEQTVGEAMTAAKSYGRKHLGHYLELRARDLRSEGFTPTPAVTLTVSIDHFDVCINAVHEDLPIDDEWRTATATSDQPEPVAGGRCSADALRTFDIGG